MPLNFHEEEKSPCVGCEHEARDKNHVGCRNCEDRIAYMGIGNPISIPVAEEPVPKRKMDPISLRHIPIGLDQPRKKRRGPGKKNKVPNIPEPIAAIISEPDVPETDFGNITKTPQLKICSTCKKPKPLKQFYKASDKKNGHRSACIRCSKKSNNKDYYRRRYGLLLDFDDHKDIYDRIEALAKTEMRMIDQQIMFILRDWLEGREKNDGNNTTVKRCEICETGCDKPGDGS